MTTSPTSHTLQKGSFIVIDTNNQPLAFEFQYNPDTLTRQLLPQFDAQGAGSSGSGLPRLKAPPEQVISFQLALDATDQLERADPTALDLGILPGLAALEQLLYPKLQQVEAQEKLKAAGQAGTASFETLLLLLSLGSHRILPVRVEGLQIAEEAFDANLNPLRATVSIELRVLTYFDLGFDTPGGKAFLTYQQNIEQWAALNREHNPA